MSEPNALLNKLPHVRIAVRKPSSLRLDHFERRNRAPYLSVSVYMKHALMAAYREKCALADTQEETRQESAGKVVGGSSQDRYEAPKGHGNGEVYGGFSEMIEEYVPV